MGKNDTYLSNILNQMDSEMFVFITNVLDVNKYKRSISADGEEVIIYHILLNICIYVISYLILHINEGRQG